MFMSKAQPRATKEYYPPHLTGRGSRGLMALAFELFGHDLTYGCVDTPCGEIINPSTAIS